MKNAPSLRYLSMVFALLALHTTELSAAPQNVAFGPSFEVFYNELSPYGDWVQDPNLGYVWVPFVDASFQPYLTNGYWEMTTFGNTWVSNYTWGWAPFHYGRWFRNSFYGWAWVPGYEWGPAWVSWRTGAGYYGWAPLAPGLSVSIGFFAPAQHWVFIPQNRFRHSHFARYCVPRHSLNRVFNRTTVINNTYVCNNQTFYTGPSRREVERVTRTRVPVYEVRESSRPGRTVVNQNSMNVYRPNTRYTHSSESIDRPGRNVVSEGYRDRSNSNRVESRQASRGPVPTQANDNRQSNYRRSAQAFSRDNRPSQQTYSPREANRPGALNRAETNDSRTEGLGKRSRIDYDRSPRRNSIAPSTIRHSYQPDQRPQTQISNRDVQPNKQRVSNPTPRRGTESQITRRSTQNPSIQRDARSGQRTNPGTSRRGDN